ncbi:MAG: hypothetical protein RBT60_08760 [Candidatus Krumholzibacteria bacterium]|jgi:hypothetical protein|nr:hypothetical protein [Candidatus Krumholzibacteria bacterium]
MTRCQRSWALSTLIVLTVLVIAAPPAGASLARLRALGDGAAYLEDDANVLVWFASLVDYPDQVVLDLGHLDHDAPGSLNRSLTGTAGGLHAQIDRAGRWGTVGLYAQEALPAGAPGGAISVLGARDGGRLVLGARAMFSSYFDGANSTDFYGYGQALYFHAYGLGVRCDLASGLYGDVAGEIVNVQGDASAEGLWLLPPQQTWSTWAARTRWFIGLNATTALVPVLDHRQDDRQFYSEILVAPADRHARRTAVGLGLNILPNADNLVVVSGELSWGRDLHNLLPGGATLWEYDAADFTYQDVHVRVGLETTVRPWLTVRGALQYWRLQHEQSTERGHTVPGPPDRWTSEQSIEVLVPITLGVGLHAGPFQADLVLNARWPETYGTVPFGPVSNQRGTYSGITLGYRF